MNESGTIYENYKIWNLKSFEIKIYKIYAFFMNGDISKILHLF